MLILSQDDVRRALDPAELFEAMTEGFRMLAQGQCAMPLRVAIDMRMYQGMSLFMPAYCEGLKAAGVKLVTVMNENPARNLPLIHSTYLYLSAETGELLSLMDGEYLTALRTAVVSALVTDLLGRSGGGTLAVFGTGTQAWAHAEIFNKFFSFGETLVFGRTPQSSEEFAERIERQLRKPARRAVLAELKRADVICTCTTSARPLFELKDVRSDAHINAVGAFRPDTREIGSDVVAKAAVIVDSYDAAFREAGEIVMAIDEGAILRETDHCASVDELVSGAKPTPAESQLTLFKSVGIAIEDLVSAHLAYNTAVKQGIGTRVGGIRLL
jgi:ornithine cyclodeaminase/alanine dehydrogenase-like protein (mu-crystallin family)